MDPVRASYMELVNLAGDVLVSRVGNTRHFSFWTNYCGVSRRPGDVHGVLAQWRSGLAPRRPGD